MENNKLYEALAKAQGEFELVAFDKKGHYKNDYATLPSIRRSIQPALTKYGLSIMQPMQGLPNGDAILYTIIAHESGEKVEASYYLLKGTKDDQKFAASVTYFRRFLLTSLLSISGEDDDDGEADKKHHEAERTKEPVKAVTSDKEVNSFAQHLIAHTDLESSLLPQIENYLRFVFSRLPEGRTLNDTVNKWLNDPEPFVLAFNKWLEKQIPAAVI